MDQEERERLTLAHLVFQALRCNRRDPCSQKIVYFTIKDYKIIHKHLLPSDQNKGTPNSEMNTTDFRTAGSVSNSCKIPKVCVQEDEREHLNQAGRKKRGSILQQRFKKPN